MKAFSAKKILLTAAISLAAIAGMGFVHANRAGATYVQDCDSNAIMKCGAPDASQFVKNTVHDQKGDLKSIYTAAGLSPDEYNRFVRTARAGTVYKDGRVVVDGQTVATQAASMGRNPRPNQDVLNWGFGTYYASSVKDSFQSESLPAMVMFDTDGNIEFIALNACGNPVVTNKISPKYSCDMLNKRQLPNKLNTYRFSTRATAIQNAAVAKVVYDFGDGQTTTTTNPSTEIEHTYAKPGSYTAKVTLYVNLPGAQSKVITSATCATKIDIAEPFQECLALNSKVINPKDRSFEFTVSSKQGNGSVLKGAQFTYGDGKTSDGLVKATTANTVVANHTYEKAGSYTTVAVVNFDTPTGVKAVNCQVKITISQDMCPIKPSVPKDDASCQPCVHNASLPADSPACKAPEVLAATTVAAMPSTGPAGIIGMFAGTSIAGGLGYRLFGRRRNQ